MRSNTPTLRNSLTAQQKAAKLLEPKKVAKLLEPEMAEILERKKAANLLEPKKVAKPLPNSNSEETHKFNHSI